MLDARTQGYVPLTGLSEFGFGLGSKPNDHLRLTGLHEFSVDLVPRSTLARIASRRFETSIKLSLLRVRQLKSLIFFGDRVPNLLDKEDSIEVARASWRLLLAHFAWRTL